MASTPTQKVVLKPVAKPTTACDECIGLIVFVFAGADAIVEFDEVGRILFAAGAIVSVFGILADKLAGTQLCKHSPKGGGEKNKFGLFHLK